MFSLTNTKDNFPIATDGKQKIYLNPSIRKSDDIVESDKELELLPSSKGRDVIYLFACSGAGKTHFCRNFCYQYNKHLSKNKIILFSDSGDKQDYTGVKHLKVIPIHDMEPEELKELPPTTFKDCLCLYDDIDSIINKKLRDAVYALMARSLTTGRHHNTSMLITSHVGASGALTKTILNESQKLILFPNSSSQNYYIATRYGGLTKEQADDFLNREIDSRWVCLNRHMPRYVLTQYEVIPVS